MMRIAILGAGFSGLATAWNLLQLQSSTQRIEITLFDPKGIGGGASGVAAGLMHPYVGAHAKLNWEGVNGVLATQRLLDVASKAVESCVSTSTGLLRIAISEQQTKNFLQCANNYEDVAWLDILECQNLVSGIAPYPGILIKSALTINSMLYLKGLWKACEAKGATLELTAIRTLEELNEFDLIIVAMGAASASLPELSHLKITPVKGQVLEFIWPNQLPPLTTSLSSQGYIVMNPGNATCIAGATYEREFLTEGPVLEIAKQEILPKASSIFPKITHFPIIECRSGIRASTPDHLPIVKRVNEKCWVISGMGSKGLLYHALCAERLSQEIISTFFKEI